MKLKEIVNEEFADYVKNYLGKDYVVFVNPNKRELFELKEYKRRGLRFIADAENQKFYLFPAELLHKNVAKRFELNYSETNTKVFFGEGDILTDFSKIRVTDSWMFEDIINKKELVGKIPQKWGWADRYSNLTEYLTNLKSRWKI